MELRVRILARRRSASPHARVRAGWRSRNRRRQRAAAGTPCPMTVCRGRYVRAAEGSARHEGRERCRLRRSRLNQGSSAPSTATPRTGRSQTQLIPLRLSFSRVQLVRSWLTAGDDSAVRGGRTPRRCPNHAAHNYATRRCSTNP